MPRSQQFRSYVVPIILTALFSINAVAGSREHVIYAFSECGGPAAPLIADQEGNLYGTTTGGGSSKDGCVFELSRDGTESVLHEFSGSDGSFPAAALVFDQSGNLFGTAEGGGTYGGGVAFELSPSSDGDWTEIVLYSFGGPDDGFAPRCQLVFDSTGNLYGTTLGGGNRKGEFRGGTVFELSPSSGGWTETILYSFAGITSLVGSGPVGGVSIDSEGNLYGVTDIGGAYGAGTAYEMKLKDGVYRLRLIHNFDQSEAIGPNSLTFGPDGNLYGTASFGGASLACLDCGVVFELAKATRGQWIEHTLLSLDGSFGFLPVGPPAFDDDGNLYAAALSGGPSTETSGGFGSVYKLTPRANGTWAESTLHIFFINFSKKINRDGRSPYAGVTIVGNKLFGTTAGGGIHNSGTVYKIRLRPDREDQQDPQDDN